jgi:hypothetical protein
MTDHDSLAERGRALEEEYFRRKGRELIEKMRLATAAEQARGEMAWAEGEITSAERGLLVKFARSRGIDEDSVADHQLTQRMTHRPDESVLHGARRLTAAVLSSGSSQAAGLLTADDLVAYCEQIAAASGSILGLRIGSISFEERALLSPLASDLKEGETGLSDRRHERSRPQHLRSPVCLPAGPAIPDPSPGHRASTAHPSATASALARRQLSSRQPTPTHQGPRRTARPG